MINFINTNQSKPFTAFKESYDLAVKQGQNFIEAMCISSYDSKKKIVDSRFVNLKIIEGDRLIFFTNYNSPKSKQFKMTDQVSICFFWDSINTQIRIKADIEKISKDKNKEYFANRAPEKNALAISSDQSRPIECYDDVVKNYETVLNNEDLSNCPEYWGGYSCKPFEIEFWKGNKFRLNKRDLFKKKSDTWLHSLLQP